MRSAMDRNQVRSCRSVQRRRGLDVPPARLTTNNLLSVRRCGKAPMVDGPKPTFALIGLGKMSGDIARDTLFQALHSQGLDKASVAKGQCQAGLSTPLASKPHRRRLPLHPHQSLVDDTLEEASGAAVIANAGNSVWSPSIHGMLAPCCAPALGTCVTK